MEKKQATVSHIKSVATAINGTLADLLVMAKNGRKEVNDITKRLGDRENALKKAKLNKEAEIKRESELKVAEENKRLEEKLRQEEEAKAKAKITEAEELAKQEALRLAKEQAEKEAAIRAEKEREEFTRRKVIKRNNIKKKAKNNNEI